MKYSPKEMQILLEKHGFNFKKNYGQNFIIDENTINNIIQKSEIDKDTLVIEIGPGAGSLTYKLSAAAGAVLCYEIDNRLQQVLEETLKDCNNVTVKYQDFLKSDIVSDIEKYTYTKCYVVANLPYYITTPIITKLIDEKIPVDKMVIMVQKEVGERMKATPGSKDYNSLSIFLKYYFDIKKIMDISKNVFLPKPNVDSIVVELNRKKTLIPVETTIFFKLIRDSFKQKRKTIKNNLQGYDLNKIEEILKKHNYDLSTRAEQIPIEVYIEIANSL